MIKDENLKYKNKLYYNEDKLFTGLSIDFYGTKYWYKEGKLHRENGPAIEFSNGYKYWFYNDERIYCKNNKEFLKIIKLLVFK